MMKTRPMAKRTLGKTVFALVLLAVAVPAVHAQSAPKEADSAAIKMLLSKFTDGFNGHDPAAVGALFADNADFTNLRGASLHGREKIQANFVTLFRTILKDAKRTDSPRDIRLLTPTLVAIDSDATIDGSQAPDGKPNPLRKGLMSWIVTKQGGAWHILIFHEQDFPPAPAVTTSSR
jgi:uncharacterized protein (TIGR02246 family)